MTRSELREFLASGVNALTPPPVFASGLYTFFNSNRDWEYPIVFQETAPVGTEYLQTGAPVDSWEVVLWVAKLTKVDAVPDDYEPLIDDCDLIAQKLIYQYRVKIAGYKNASITSAQREPFVKKNADCLAGVTIRFTVVSSNTENLC